MMYKAEYRKDRIQLDIQRRSIQMVVLVEQFLGGGPQKKEISHSWKIQQKMLNLFISIWLLLDNLIENEIAR